MGNVLQAGLGQNPARQASIRAGLSENIPAFTLNKVCGSGLKSVGLAGGRASRGQDGGRGAKGKSYEPVSARRNAMAKAVSREPAPGGEGLTLARRAGRCYYLENVCKDDDSHRAGGGRRHRPRAG